MNHPNNSSPANNIATESSKTEQAAAKVTSKVADVMSPETIVVDEPPPKPDYPHYRVQPGKPLVLADIDPDTAEHYKKKKDTEKELQKQREPSGASPLGASPCGFTTTLVCREQAQFADCIASNGYWRQGWHD